MRGAVEFMFASGLDSRFDLRRGTCHFDTPNVGQDGRGQGCPVLRRLCPLFETGGYEVRDARVAGGGNCCED